MRLDKITIVVDDYDRAIAFFTGALGFELAEDSPSLTNDGRPKRWVVVRPPGGESGETGIPLARSSRIVDTPGDIQPEPQGQSRAKWTRKAAFRAGCARRAGMSRVSQRDGRPPPVRFSGHTGHSA